MSQRIFIAFWNRFVQIRHIHSLLTLDTLIQTFCFIKGTDGWSSVDPHVLVNDFNKQYAIKVEKKLHWIQVMGTHDCHEI